MAWHNELFSLTDNRNYPDCRMKVRPQFLTNELMGTTNPSKTSTPSRLGDERHTPDQVFIVLKAWALFRMQYNAFLSRASRRAVFDRESESLRAEVAERGDLHANTVRALRAWAPHVLAPAT